MSRRSDNHLPGCVCILSALFMSLALWGVILLLAYWSRI